MRPVTDGFDMVLKSALRGTSSLHTASGQAGVMGESLGAQMPFNEVFLRLMPEILKPG